MRIDQQPAFILHSRAYRETSLLLEVLSRDHGRVGIVARSVRRERSRIPRGMLQPLQPVLLSWFARGELGTLTAVDSASSPFALAGDALVAALYVNELVLRLCGRNDPHAAAFDAYALCLSRLADGHDLAWTLRRFERDFLADLGYALALQQTANGEAIDADEEYAYDPESGAEAGRGAGGLIRIRGSALLALDRDERPRDDDLVQLRRLMRAVIRHFIGGNLNAWTQWRHSPSRDD
jgi:DNA repair protein RecO (recombination protein O)